MQQTSIIIIVNGQEESIIAEQMLSQWVESKFPTVEARRGLAIAIDNKIITQVNWPSTMLEPGQHLTLIRPIQGG